MAAYLGYTLRMKTLFSGWPVMVHDTHTGRRIASYNRHVSQNDPWADIISKCDGWSAKVRMLKINNVLPAVPFVRTDCYAVILAENSAIHIKVNDVIWYRARPVCDSWVCYTLMNKYWYQQRRYWPITNKCMPLRGGTSRGRPKGLFPWTCCVDRLYEHKLASSSFISETSTK